MEISQHKKTALLFGASGLVGGYCLDHLLRHPAYHKVHSFGRRELDKKHPKLQQHIIDFDQLEGYGELFIGQDVYSCLGTTMAKAGSKEAFRKVDYTYVLDSARLAAERGASQLMLVSSVGADEDALFFYSQVKGEIEAAVKQLPYWAVHIFQPSLLLGPREERRVAEQLAVRAMGGLAKWMQGETLGKYRPVEAEDVAKAMIVAAQRLNPGQFIYRSDEIYEMAQYDKRLH
jgi:uncharacterized protein YbjT (DUF2867 family)